MPLFTCFIHFVLCSAQICEMSQVFCVPVADSVQHRQTHSVIKREVRDKIRAVHPK